MRVQYLKCSVLLHHHLTPGKTYRPPCSYFQSNMPRLFGSNDEGKPLHSCWYVCGCICLCVCVCVCLIPSLIVNTISQERKVWQFSYLVHRCPYWVEGPYCFGGCEGHLRAMGQMLQTSLPQGRKHGYQGSSQLIYSWNFKPCLQSNFHLTFYYKSDGNVGFYVRLIDLVASCQLVTGAGI